MRKTNQLIDYMPKKKLDWIQEIWRDPRTSEVCINLAPGYICDVSGGRTIVAHDINAMIEIFRRSVHPVTTIEVPKLKLVRIVRKNPNRPGKVHLNGADGFTYCSTEYDEANAIPFDGVWDEVDCMLCKAKRQREINQRARS